jgi:uncharacterized protein (TIRG00374 family)
LRKHLKFIALVLLAALILWLFGRTLNWAEVREAVSQSDKRLLVLAAVFVCVTYLLRAYRWRALLAPLTPASMRELFVATTVGFGAVFIFGRAGEIVRPVVLPLRDRRVRPAASFVTIMVERVCDSMAVVVLFAVNLLWISAPAGREAEFGRVRLAGLVLLAVGLLGVAGLAWFERRSKRAVHWVNQRLIERSYVSARIRRAIVGTLEQLASALSILADARELAVTVGWTALVWAVIVLADWLIIRAFGLPFSPAQAIFVMGFALVGSLVPTPGGAAGAFHVATMAGLVFLGVGREQGAAIAIMTNLIVFAPAVFIGLYYVVRGNIDLAQLRQLTSPEAVEHVVEDEHIETPEMLEKNKLEMAAVNE